MFSNSNNGNSSSVLLYDLPVEPTALVKNSSTYILEQQFTYLYRVLVIVTYVHSFTVSSKLKDYYMLRDTMLIDLISFDTVFKLLSLQHKSNCFFFQPKK